MKDSLQDTFEDLYRAKMRLSVAELGEVLEQLEALPQSSRRDLALAQKMLRSEYERALAACEERLAELRRRYAALPELQPRRLLKIV